MAFEIVQILGSGRFGHVAVVRDAVTGALLAAKVLKDEHLQNDKVIRRMRDEAVLLHRLKHPNVVKVEGILDFDGRPVLFLEWVRGVALDWLLARMPQGLPPGDAAEIVRLAVQGLHDAWYSVDPVSGRQMRVIHRDLKPSNLLLSADGVVKVVDFGISKAYFDGKESQTTTAVLGAHAYLAPERLDGEEDTPAGDVYSMGCVLFELLTGQRMQLSIDPTQHFARLQEQLMAMKAPGLQHFRTATGLTNVVKGMCEYEPDARLHHAEVLDRLARIVGSPGYEANLKRLARQHVVPYLEDRAFEPPRRHPAYADLRFLEVASGETPPGAAPRASDDVVRGFLAQEGWHTRADELRRRLVMDPSWTAAPFLEQLDRLQPSTSFWGRRTNDAERNAQLAAVLEFLVARPDPEVVARVKPLVRHRDPQVVALARQITG